LEEVAHRFELPVFGRPYKWGINVVWGVRAGIVQFLGGEGLEEEDIATDGGFVDWC